MKLSYLRKEAKEVLNTVFLKVLESEEKEVWKKAIGYIDYKIFTLEARERGEKMFIWREVKKQITNLFGEKFIKNK